MNGVPRVFGDRREAGRYLAAAVADLKPVDPVVLALPRGGVPVGFEVAQKLGCPLDVLLVRKIGAPGHEEYGIGAVVDGDPPQRVIDEGAARMVGADRDYIERIVAREIKEIERRRAAYRPGPPIALAGKTVIVVDDGIATGGTARAALKGLAKSGAKRIILAVPVAPPEAVTELQPLCDTMLCLNTPELFMAVGAHYEDFGQTEDSEVISLLEQARQKVKAEG